MCRKKDPVGLCDGQLFEQRRRNAGIERQAVFLGGLVAPLAQATPERIGQITR